MESTEILENRYFIRKILWAQKGCEQNVCTSVSRAPYNIIQSISTKFSTQRSQAEESWFWREGRIFRTKFLSNATQPRQQIDVKIVRNSDESVSGMFCLELSNSGNWEILSATLFTEDNVRVGLHLHWPRHTLLIICQRAIALLLNLLPHLITRDKRKVPAYWSTYSAHAQASHYARAPTTRHYACQLSTTLQRDSGSTIKRQVFLIVHLTSHRHNNGVADNNVFTVCWGL